MVKIASRPIAIKEPDMPNPFAHIELNTDDVSKAKKFYKRLFQWKLGPMGPDYTMIDVGRGTGGGMQKKAMPEAPTMWLPYVEVEDVKKTIDKARKLGAGIVVEHMDIGEMGSIGVFTDPSGASIGVWAQAAKPAQAAKAEKGAKAEKKKTKAEKKKAKK
jgi:predicted enzyme related to lactoylglutathione lyase